MRQIAPILNVIKMGKDWLIKGWAELLPEAWLNFGAKPVILISLPCSKGETATQLLRTKSIFGQYRDVEIEETVKESNVPKIHCLASHLVFETEFTLPKLSPRNTKEAIRLRLKEYSPIPTDECIFSFLTVQSESNTKQSIKLAIISSASLKNFADEHPVGTAVGFLNQSGDLYSFDDEVTTFSRSKRSLLTIGFGIVAALLVLVATTQLKRSTTSVKRDIAQHIQILKSTNAELKITSQADDALQNIHALTDNTYQQILESVLTSLPQSARIDSITYRGGTVTLDGYLPESEANVTVPPNYSFARRSSTHPGYDYFSYQFMSGAGE